MIFDGNDETYGYPDGSNAWDMAERQVERAFELYEDGHTEDALSAISEAVSLNPENDRWHFNKALTLDAMERFDEAIEEFSAALELNPNDVETLNCLGVDYTRTGRYDLAMATFERLEKLEPDFEPCYCNRIITCTEMGNYEQAEQMFYMAQQIDENCPLCFYNIGNMFFIKGDFKKAFWCWQKTASLEPNHPQINYRLAQACWNMDNNVNAKHYFIEELRLNAGDVEVIFDFGLFLLHGGDVAAAKEKFNRILEVEPAHSEALFYRGEIELNNDNAALAEQFYRRATDSDSRLAGPRFRLGAMALEQGRKEEAFVLLAAELELDIGQSEVLSSIGQMMMALGQKDYAMHCFLRAVETDSPKADNYINLASALAERGEDSEAEQFLEYALELGQFSREVTLSVVRCYLAMKRFEKAEMLLQSLNCSSLSFVERFFRYYVKLRFLTGL